MMRNEPIFDYDDAPIHDIFKAWTKNATIRDETGGLMHATEQNEHISAEIPIRILNMLKQASAIKGETLNQFLVQAAFEKAKSVIEDDRIITLSEWDAKLFFDAIDNPPKASEKLKKAMERYRDTFKNVEKEK